MKTISKLALVALFGFSHFAFAQESSQGSFSFHKTSGAPIEEWPTEVIHEALSQPTSYSGDLTLAELVDQTSRDFSRSGAALTFQFDMPAIVSEDTQLSFKNDDFESYQTQSAGCSVGSGYTVMQESCSGTLVSHYQCVSVTIDGGTPTTQWIFAGWVFIPAEVESIGSDC